jgi:hypothetical protein
MIFIAHRGNINGSDPINENSPMQIASALQSGFQVECDIRVIQGRLYLGHDSAQYEVHSNFVLNERLWLHCKSPETLHVLMNNQCSKVFFHANDDCTLVADTGTSSKWIWTYSGKPLTSQSIAVLPELGKWSKEQLEKCAGICSDYVVEYKKDLGFMAPKPIETPAIVAEEKSDIGVV